MPDNLVHRDDVPPEALQQLQEQYPDFKIVCAGDQPEGSLPEDLQAAIKELEARHRKSLDEGSCIDCGAKMPNYPPTTDAEWDAWELPEGWRYFSDSYGPTAFQCPACDAKDGDGLTMVELPNPEQPHADHA